MRFVEACINSGNILSVHVMFSKQLLSPLQWLLFTFRFSHGVHGGECDGTQISERIKETQSRHVDVLPGNQVVINWTWCSAVNSTVTGIVIYRVLWPKSRNRLKHVLSMDLSKAVHYLKDNLKHELRSIENKMSFEEKTIFIINNVTTADGGTYSLHVRREGHRDLQSEVQVIVRTSTEELQTTPLTEATRFVSDNNTNLPTNQKSKNQRFPVLTAAIVSAIGFFILIVVVFVAILSRKQIKIRRSEHRSVFAFMCCGSNQGSLSESLVKAEPA